METGVDKCVETIKEFYSNDVLDEEYLNDNIQMLIMNTEYLYDQVYNSPRTRTHSIAYQGLVDVLRDRSQYTFTSSQVQAAFKKLGLDYKEILKPTVDYIDQERGDIMEENLNENKKLAESVIWSSQIDADNIDIDYYKEGPYQDYLDNLDEYEEPNDFETWLDNNYEMLDNDYWIGAEEELDNTILPAIDKQLNRDVIFILGYYNSNYGDYTPSSNGGKMFNDIDEFRSYILNFDSVTITSNNGILGVSLGDHDGSISGNLYTLPKDCTELLKALGYEKYVREDYDEDYIEDYLKNYSIEDLMEQEFNDNLIYNGMDAEDFIGGEKYLVPIKNETGKIEESKCIKTESEKQEIKDLENDLKDKNLKGDQITDIYIDIKDIKDKANKEKRSLTEVEPINSEELNKDDEEWFNEKIDKENNDKADINADESEKTVLDYLQDRVDQELTVGELNTVLQSIFAHYNTIYLLASELYDKDPDEIQELVVFDDADIYNINYEIVDMEEGIVKIMDVNVE